MHLNMKVSSDTFSSHAVANVKLVMDSVIILTLKDDMEFIDTFITHAFDNDTF